MVFFYQCPFNLTSDSITYLACRMGKSHMQFCPFWRLNMMDTIHRTFLICCLGSSMCKAEDLGKKKENTNEQCKLQCKEKHNTLCHFAMWFWLILESLPVTASKNRTWYGSLSRQIAKPCSQVEIIDPFSSESRTWPLLNNVHSTFPVWMGRSCVFLGSRDSPARNVLSRVDSQSLTWLELPSLQCRFWYDPSAELHGINVNLVGMWPLNFHCNSLNIRFFSIKCKYLVNMGTILVRNPDSERGHFSNSVWNYQGSSVDISRYLIKLFYCPDFFR